MTDWGRGPPRLGGVSVRETEEEEEVLEEREGPVWIFRRGMQWVPNLDLQAS